MAEDWYFWSHRRLLALAALDKSYDVYVLTQVNDHAKRIRELGFELIPITIERHGKSVIRELKLLYDIIKIYQRIKPDIAHHIAMKPVLYGTLATLFTKSTKVVNTLAGLGYIFASKRFSDKIIASLLIHFFKCLFMLRPVQLIVQNSDDASFLMSKNVCKDKRLTLIRGSGVDLKEYAQSGAADEVPTILFASRLLWQKGLADFVAAAALLRERYPYVRFVIVGEPDEHNSNSVPVKTLKAWVQSGSVEWWGYQSNMPKILSRVKMVVLPSVYGEGVPKILIEAAACGKPVIATDMPGCREIVIHNHNGYLVEAHDPAAIAERISALLDDDGLCQQMGERGRRLVAAEFSIDRVNSETLSLYAKLLAPTGVPLDSSA